jgi:drug/metabolite transporter (DMT)-like permease
MRFERLAPWLFVALWSTGFVVARYATNDASPLTFLAIRMVIAAVLLALIARALRAPRISLRQSWVASLVGVGMHAVYLGGVFVAIDRGLPSGLSALIAGLHPVVTAVFGRMVLGERLRRSQWLGVLLGLVGVVAVVGERLGDGSKSVTTVAIVAMVLSIIGISSGTLIQRARGRDMPLLRGTSMQYSAAAVALIVAIPLIEDASVRITPQFLLALGWATLVLSLGAVLIMMRLLASHSAARVSSLFFLTPALSALEGAVLFGERMGMLAIVGLGVAACGVWLTMREKPSVPVDAAA